MAAVVAWLDYSEDDRRRMREVIELFREHDTLDELGIGSIRDTFADLLFPGISTVQTRAAYFLLIPWVYLDIERRKVPSRQVADEARRLELRLISALERGGATGGQGVIGWDARNTLKRLPSTVYWGGLGTFGIRRFHGSILDYHRSFDGYLRRVDSHARGDGDEVHERLVPNWHTALPPAPDEFLDEITLDLRSHDAEFLRDQMVTSRPESLLAHLLRVPAETTDADLPWDVAELSSVPSRLATTLEHARWFSDVMHGAALAFNLMLARLAVSRGMSGQYGDWTDMYTSQLTEWADRLDQRQDAFEQWNLDEFWEIIRTANTRIRVPTHAFITQWITLAREHRGDIVTLDPAVTSLISRREQQLKRGQARLSNHRALERWGGASGTAQLSYRWPVARRIIDDINSGLASA